MKDHLKPLPITNFSVEKNTEILDAVKGTDTVLEGTTQKRKGLNSFQVDPRTILKHTNSIVRGQETFLASEEAPMLEFEVKGSTPEERFASTYGHIGQVAQTISVYEDPRAPIQFPQAEDVIKSLNFAAASGDQTPHDAIIEYYQTVIKLMQKEITPDQYYERMPRLLERVKDFVLNENDWEALRDAVLRVQRYIIHYMWEDMQKISMAMDDGFAVYQKQLNDWIDEANKFYSTDDYLPGGSVRLHHLGRGQNNGLYPADVFEVQQNVKYLIDGMCVQIAKDKPGFPSGNGNDVNHYPTNKQMVWIEELDI